MSARTYDPAIPDDAAGTVDVVAEVRRKEALLKTGALQNAIFNSANFSSIATDAKGVIQIFNVGAERMLGYTAADVLNKITPADISDPQEVITRAKALSVELGTPITPGFEALVFKASRGIEDIYELTYIRKDGSRFPAIVSVTALRDDQDGIIGYLLIGTDNTARKQAEEALLQAGALQRAIFNSANFSSIATDAKGVIQIFNVGAERMLGYTAADVLNKITPADISDPQEVITRAKALSVELGTPITPGFEALVFKASRGIEDIYELTYIRKDGSRFPAVVSVTALRDAQDAIIGYLLIGTDNTAHKRAEEALLQAGALQRAIFNSANFSSIATDAKGVIQIFNVGAERMLGYTAADVLNKITPADISDPQEVITRAKALSVELGTPIAPGFEALVFKASRGIEDIYELTYFRKDGSRFPAVVSVTALRDAQDAIIGYLLIGTDNTARKQAEEALLQAGALQRAIFNSANFSSIATDAKGVIQIFNVGAERMLGYTAADVLNKITPADISDPQEVITRAKALSVELGTPITPGFEALVFKASRGIEDIYELTYFRKDGSRFPAVVSVTALRDDQDGIIGYLLIGTDNTARKRVEAEQQKLDQRLRDQQFYTRSLIESNIDAIMTTDPAGIITDVNRQMEALTGCTRDELIGAPFKNHFTDSQRAEAAIKLVLREKKVTNYELTARARDGKTTVVSYDATTFYDRDRTLQGVFAAARDVTERKHIEQMLQEKNVELERAKSVAEQTVERLEEVERLKQGFLSTVSHELRTPLTSIRGSLGLLASGAVGALSDEVVEVVAIAERNAVRLIALINDILDLDRLETGKIELQFGQVSAESVLRRAIESVGTFAQEHGVTVEAPEVSSTIWADADRIVQVLVNLLSNAVKFSPSAGVVTIGVQPGEGWVEFRVTDRGRGVPAAYRRAIFERFRQIETSDAREKGGTGLGLAICKSIIDQHGGTIGVESEEGGGSTFWVRVATAPRPVAPRLGRAILVCGDDAERRGSFEEVIRQAGYTVITVPDADAAWAVLQGGDVAAVLLEGNSALLARIRKEPAFEAIPVILFGSPLVVSPEALSDSLVLFLPERVDSRELLVAIRDGLERGRVAAQARYVLLVEDDLTLLDVMARQLSREGIAVRTATTGKEAIRVAEAEPPALMVLDVGLPERDGFDVVDAMRQRPELRDIPVLVYTGRDLTEEQRGRLRLGPTRFLTKSKASDGDFRRLVVELRQIPPARSADIATQS